MVYAKKLVGLGIVLTKLSRYWECFRTNSTGQHFRKTGDVLAHELKDIL
jgi:hypothetical protein